MKTRPWLLLVCILTVVPCSGQALADTMHLWGTGKMALDIHGFYLRFVDDTDPTDATTWENGSVAGFLDETGETILRSFVGHDFQNSNYQVDLVGDVVTVTHVQGGTFKCQFSTSFDPDAYHCTLIGSQGQWECDWGLGVGVRTEVPPTPPAGPQHMFGWGGSGSELGHFLDPRAVAVDGITGDVYVADRANDRIQKFATFVTTWGTSGAGDGQFNGPAGVAVDGAGNVYVVDTGNHRIQKFTSVGAFVTKWGSPGTGDGQFADPTAVCVDAGGDVYVADYSNHRIQKFASTGAFLTKWGVFGSGDGQFSFPYGVAVDGGGNVYVSEASNNRVQKFTGTGGFLLKWGGSGVDSGQFSSPANVATDGAGFVYVADTGNHRIQRFTGTGVLTTIWGGFGTSDGQFDSPYGVAADRDRFVYVADSGNNRIQQFGFWPATGVEPRVPQRRLWLAQNYPNPFNPSTSIRFSLAEEDTRVRLSIFDAAGREVRRVLDGPMTGGPHVVRWDGTDGSGRPMTSGIYFYRLKAAGFVGTRKMVLVK